MNDEDRRYAIVIHPDSTVEVAQTPGGWREIKRLVGGYFENVYYTNFKEFPIVVSVHEIGKLIRKPFNMLGTLLYGDPYDFLVGNVVIFKLDRVGEYDELDHIPLTSSEVEILKKHLSSLH